ncbi:uncharacterized protein LOC108046891 [Drosophila rhopaloa]|uniref:Uncharacterized protein LOC108046891 n=1 Tax=Drosophila rhopaloa TaxID=1041015 RepID=A0A6P4EVW4_DRORH|nr:uncharacterized protein LOC108046891 [Drosophila rhopaloa]
MSKKFPNPVSKHFIYSEQTRKSTCRECHFDMAGRHSENLMRHLKRKHEDVYEVVVAQKRAIRTLLCQQQANKGDNVPSDRQLATPLLELRDLFPPEHKKIRLNKDASRLPTNSAIETTDIMDDEEAVDGDNEDNVSGNQFDGVFKLELPDEEYQSNDSGDGDLETISPSMAKPSISLKAVTTSLASSTTSTQTNAPARAVIPARTSSVCPIAGDDDFYLQYLGNKLSKYSARTKNTVQFQINRILYKADMGCFEDADLKIGDSALLDEST